MFFIVYYELRFYLIVFECVVYFALFTDFSVKLIVNNLNYFEGTYSMNLTFQCGNTISELLGAYYCDLFNF